MEIRHLDSSLERFIQGLELFTRVKVFHAFGLLERFGYTLRMPLSRKVDRDLFELRIRGVQEVRIFYTFHQRTIILFHGFIKKSQRIPTRELQLAIRKLYRDLT